MKRLTGWLQMAKLFFKALNFLVDFKNGFHIIHSQPPPFPYSSSSESDTFCNMHP